MANSADPDELASSDLHCLLRQGMSCSTSEGLRSQQIWIYTVCKGRVYPGSAGQGLRVLSVVSRRMLLNFFNNAYWVIIFKLRTCEQADTTGAKAHYGSALRPIRFCFSLLILQLST